jgi:hypothetical protein
MTKALEQAAQANGMTRQRRFTEEVSRPYHRDDGFSAGMRQYRELDRTLLNVHDDVSGITLGEDDVHRLLGHGRLPRSQGTKKRIHIKRRFCLTFIKGWSAPNYHNPAGKGSAMSGPDRRAHTFTM